MIDKRQFWPAAHRKNIEAGRMRPVYRLRASDYDKLPLDTFLVESRAGTGGYPERLMRIVAPRRPEQYSTALRSPGGRLLYVCWEAGNACKKLLGAGEHDASAIILPDDPEFELVAGFKVACDTKRAWAKGPAEFAPTLLLRALVQGGYLDLRFCPTNL